MWPRQRSLPMLPFSYPDEGGFVQVPIDRDVIGPLRVAERLFVLHLRHSPGRGINPFILQSTSPRSRHGRPLQSSRSSRGEPLLDRILGYFKREFLEHRPFLVSLVWPPHTHLLVREVQGSGSWLYIRPSLGAEGLPGCPLLLGVDIGEPHLKCWRRLLHQREWRPILAGLTLRRSLQRDLPAVPAPSSLCEPSLRHQGCRLYWRRRRLLEASLLLRWPLRMDRLVTPTPSLRLDERRW